MRDSKRRRLEPKGWRIDDAKAFLGLSEEESAYIGLKEKLVEALRGMRIRRHITQVELAKALRTGQSRVSKMETCDPSVSLDMLIRALQALRASDSELGRIIAGPK